MRKILMILGIFSSLVITGCASVPMASQEEDMRAKEFKPRPDKASVYVYRNETLGGAIKMTVGIDGQIIGQTGPGTYFLVYVDPGKHTINSLTENNVSITIDTQKGKNYFIWQEVKMGMMSAQSALHVQPENDGRRGVMECKLAQKM